MPYLNFFFRNILRVPIFPTPLRLLAMGQHYIFDNFLGESIRAMGTSLTSRVKRSRFGWMKPVSSKSAMA